MRIVIAHESLEAFAGTETYMFTVAQQLDHLGHDPVMYAQRTGPMADFARSQGVRATDNVAELPRSCDLVLAQDAASALELARRYPDTVRVFVAHSDYFALQTPPQLDGVCHAVVVMNDRMQRFVEQLGFHAPIVRLRQPVDLQRFGRFGLYPDQAQRALVIGNYLRGAQASLLEEACRAAGLEVSWIGSHARPTARPEHAIASADVVIGIGRCVIEAMAGRRAAYVYGIAGGDGWVTPTNYAALEADGFSGQVTGTARDIDTLVSDLRGWDPGMGHDNRALANAHHDAHGHAIELVALARELGAPGSQPPTYAQELARLVRMEWQTWGRFASAVNENQALREQLEAARREAQQSQTEADARAAALSEAEQRLEVLRRTRRYRLASRIAAPLDALRRSSRHP